MRTVVVNTTGKEIDEKNLVFSVHEENRLFWIRHGIDEMDPVAGEVSLLLENQSDRDEFQIIVLVDMNDFPRSSIGTVRAVDQKFLTAWFNTKFYLPLAEKEKKLFRGVSEFFLCSEKTDGEYGNTEENVYKNVFFLQEAPAAGYRVFFETGAGKTDVSAFFAPEIDAFRAAMEKTVRRAEKKELPFAGLSAGEQKPLYVESEVSRRKADREQKDLQNQCVADFDHAVREKIEKNSRCYYTGDNDATQKEIRITAHEVTVSSDDRRRSCFDFCLNLSRFILELNETEGAGDLPVFRPVRHSEKELGELFGKNLAALSGLKKEIYHQKYYSFSPIPAEFSGLAKGEVEKRLSEDCKGVFGVEYAQDDTKGEIRPSEPLKKACFFLKNEKKRFFALYAEMQSHYRSETLDREQKAITTACTEGLKKWRNDAKNRDAGEGPAELSEQERPVYSPKDCAEKITAIQKKCTEKSLRMFEEYDDVRCEAAKIRSRFETVVNIWDPQDEPKKLPKFYRFSLLMAGIAVLILMVPYLAVELQKIGTGIPFAFSLLFNLAAFAVLYGIGFFLWTRSLSRRAHRETTALWMLVFESGKKRVQSIRDMLDVYETGYPALLAISLEDEKNRATDSKNALRAKCYACHAQLIEKYKGEVKALLDSLKLTVYPAEDGGEPTASLDLSEPPRGPHNRKLYYSYLFEEKEEGRK